MNGKSIRIFLTDGQSTGLLTAEIMNWTGKVIVVPRSQLEKLAAREEARRTGAYLLVGSSPHNYLKETVYVGESDNILSRITSHDKNKEFWTKAAFIVSKDENITKAHARYLESRLIEIIRSAGRADLDNGTNPPVPALPEADVSDMEYFLNQLRIVLPVLGMGFLQPVPTPEAAAGSPETAGSEESPLFICRQGNIEARAREIGSEFIVLKGSTARIEGVKSWDSYITLRDQLVADGKLIKREDSDVYVFSDNVAFSSPSAASACVLARNANGRTEWKIEGTMQTYQEWHKEKLEKAGLEP